MAEKMMKDSGIEKLGIIPADWKTRRLKYICSSKITNISTDVIKESGRYKVFGAAGLMGYIASKEMDQEYIGIVKDGAGAGRMDFYPAESSLLGTMAYIIPNNNVNIKWLMYVISSLNLGDSVDKTTIPHIYFSEYGNSFVCYPSYSEQACIADFLDKKVSEIDAVISKTKESIEEYKKLKQSIITEAVTKGLDPNAEMKDSGIEWIGEIPNNWKINTAFQLFTQVKNKNLDLQEKNLLSLSYGKIKRKNIETTEGLLPESFDGYNIIEADDIVLRLTDLQNDHKSLRVGIATERGIVTSAYITLRNRSRSLAKYLYYFLHSFDIAKGFYGMGAGVRQGLNWDGLKWLKILNPPIDDQIKIVDYLDKISSSFDDLVSKKENLINQLEQYKKSLIYEYVTGKKEVA